MEACGFAPGLCVFVVFVSRVYQTPAPTMPMLQQPRRGLRSVALIFLMQMLCEELQSPKASFATTCEHFGCRFRIFVVCLHTQRVPMFHKATTLHYVWIFKFMISDADSDIESEIPKYCTMWTSNHRVIWHHSNRTAKASSFRTLTTCPHVVHTDLSTGKVVSPGSWG